MIEFHRPEKDTFSDKVEDRFAELVLAYKTHRYTGDSSQKSGPLPRIEDGEKTVTGREAITDYIDQLRIDLRDMRAFTGDACYVDPDTGGVC